MEEESDCFADLAEVVGVDDGEPVALLTTLVAEAVALLAALEAEAVALFTTLVADAVALLITSEGTAGML